MEIPIEIDTIKGFLDPEEGRLLYRFACQMGGHGPIVEIGSYCGKSAVYLGTACRDSGTVLFSVDHHCGSEENQPGWEYHDVSLWDEEAERLDTLPAFRTTLRRADLEDHVVPVVGKSSIVGRYWTMPLAMLFIDGGHTLEAALTDYRVWTPHIRPGGLLAIHDVFPNPEDGGRPPFEIHQLALASGQFEDLAEVKSLRILKRLG